jgi:hypothetical protein
MVDSRPGRRAEATVPEAFGGLCGGGSGTIASTARVAACAVSHSVRSPSSRQFDPRRDDRPADRHGGWAGGISDE